MTCECSLGAIKSLSASLQLYLNNASSRRARGSYNLRFYLPIVHTLYITIVWVHAVFYRKDSFEALVTFENINLVHKYILHKIQFLFLYTLYTFKHNT